MKWGEKMAKCPHCNAEIEYLVHSLREIGILYFKHDAKYGDYEMYAQDFSHIDDDYGYSCPKCCHRIANTEVEADRFLTQEETEKDDKFDEDEQGNITVKL